MYFWNYQRLAEFLKAGGVTQKQYLAYIVFFCLFVVFVDAIFLLILMIPFYFVNKKGDVKAYLKRFICISLPIHIRALVFSLVVGTVTAIAFGGYGVYEAFNNADAANHDFQVLMATFSIIGILIMMLGYMIKMYFRAFKIMSNT